MLRWRSASLAPDAAPRVAPRVLDDAPPLELDGLRVVAVLEQGRERRAVDAARGLVVDRSTALDVRAPELVGRHGQRRQVVVAPGHERQTREVQRELAPRPVAAALRGNRQRFYELADVVDAADVVHDHQAS